jgi:hypothetical protein
MQTVRCFAGTKREATKEDHVMGSSTGIHVMANDDAALLLVVPE